MAKANKRTAGSSPAKEKVHKKDLNQKLSRGQLKRLEKRQRFLKKEKMILASLKLRHKEDQAKRIDGVDALKEALSEVKTAKEEPIKIPPPTTNKAKRSLVQKETAQLNLVLQHPQFQADPITTMKEHLENTIQKAKPTKRPEPVKRKRRTKRTFKATRSKR